MAILKQSHRFCYPELVFQRRVQLICQAFPVPFPDIQALRGRWHKTRGSNSHGHPGRNSGKSLDFFGYVFSSLKSQVVCSTVWVAHWRTTSCRILSQCLLGRIQQPCQYLETHSGPSHHAGAFHLMMVDIYTKAKWGQKSYVIAVLIWLSLKHTHWEWHKHSRSNCQSWSWQPWCDWWLMSSSRFQHPSNWNHCKYSVWFRTSCWLQNTSQQCFLIPFLLPAMFKGLYDWFDVDQQLSLCGGCYLLSYKSHNTKK